MDTPKDETKRGGWTLSDGTKTRMSESAQGRTHTEETKQKISQALKKPPSTKVQLSTKVTDECDKLLRAKAEVAGLTIMEAVETAINEWEPGIKSEEIEKNRRKTTVILTFD